MTDRLGSPGDNLNPYWDQQGKTFVDPYGYRVVLQNADWALEKRN